MRFWPYLVFGENSLRMGVPASYKSLLTHPWFPTSLLDVEDECRSSLASSVGGHPWLVCALGQELMKLLILVWAGGAGKGWALQCSTPNLSG